VVEEAPVVVTESSSSAAAVNNENNNSIWMSDVVVRKRRPYFLNRKWSSKDVIYGGFMVFMHALCLLAPFTFSWSAFGVFMALYVITGMFGITLSFHRNLSHKSFKLPKWLEYTFAYCGVQALQVS
jgi:stearoyl-CoA desaturase (delta-9 desaturase)